jgi:Serine/threonine protein kinase
MDEKFKKHKKYLICSKIAEGTFSKVYEAINSETMETVAIKVLKSKEQETERETKVLELVKKCPSVVRFIESFADKEKKIYIVTELVKGERLSYKLRTKEELVELFKKITKPFIFLHSLKVAHLDIKPRNILVKGDGEVIIIDFGLSCLSECKDKLLQYNSKIIGSLGYMSPEMMGQNVSNIFAADVYSLGVTFFYLLNGYLPFSAKGFQAIKRKKELGMTRMILSIYEDLNELVDEMISIVSEFRPTMQEVYQRLEEIKC